jgi:hypothetical protein
MIDVTQHIADIAGIVGFLICIATALILAVRSTSKKRDG